MFVNMSVLVSSYVLTDTSSEMSACLTDIDGITNERKGLGVGSLMENILLNLQEEKINLISRLEQ